MKSRLLIISALAAIATGCSSPTAPDPCVAPFKTQTLPMVFTDVAAGTTTTRMVVWTQIPYGCEARR